MKNNTIKIGVHQMQINFQKQQANFTAIMEKIDRLDCDFHIFPEAATSGFNYDKLAELAVANGQFMEELLASSRKEKFSVTLPLLAQTKNSFRNRLYAVTNGRVLGIYDKIHLIGLLQEDKYLESGADLLVADLGLQSGQFLRIGFGLCYDLRFPELFRSMVSRFKPDLFVVPAEWPTERIEHLRILSRARAVENLTPIIICNGVGECGNLNLGGRSCGIDARGEILYEASCDQTESFIIEIDTGKTNEWRESFGALADICLIS